MATSGMFWSMTSEALLPPWPPGSFVVARPLVPVGLGRVELVGRVSAGRGVQPRTARRYPNHAVVLVTRGAGSYWSPSGSVPLGVGSLVIVRPGEPHWYGPAPGRTWDEAFCAFSGPVFDLAVRTGALGGPARVVQTSEAPRVQALLERIRVAPPPGSTSTQDAEALDLLAHLTRAVNPDAGQAAVGWLARSMHLLAADGTGPDLAQVADAVGIPYETWRRRFRAEVGIPPARYRIDARVRSAASLLSMTSLSVTDIAHRLGFVDDRHLARHFTRRYGVPPGRFRQSSQTTADLTT